MCRRGEKVFWEMFTENDCNAFTHLKGKSWSNEGGDGHGSPRCLMSKPRRHKEIGASELGPRQLAKKARNILFFVASNAPASRVLAGGVVWMGVARGDEWRDEQRLTRCTRHNRDLLRR